MIGTFIQVDGEINDRTKDKKRIMGICCLLIQMNVLFMGNFFFVFSFPNLFQNKTRSNKENNSNIYKMDTIKIERKKEPLMI